MKLVRSFTELIPNYDTFVFDIWGVVHDGVKPFPGIRPTLEALKSAGKEVIFLSNMSQLSDEVEEHLNAMGIPRNLYSFVLSSGQAAIEYIQSLASQGKVNCFHLNDERGFRKYFTHLNINFVDDVTLADYLLVARGPLIEAVSSTRPTLLETAVKSGIPLICANPDTGVVIDGKFEERPGSVVGAYKKLGGKTLTFGKPHDVIYETLTNKPALSGKTLMIGDSLETDIAGARAQGWDALLVLTGVTAHKNGWLMEPPSVQDLQVLESDTGPTYVFSGFTT